MLLRDWLLAMIYVRRPRELTDFNANFPKGRDNDSGEFTTDQGTGLFKQPWKIFKDKSFDFS